MWRSLKNVLYSFRTYAELGPDLRVRRRINRSLRDRPLLQTGEWHQTFWQTRCVSRKISDFVYIQLQECSGLDMGRVQPGDRLNEDLHLPLTCWFDWETVFCDEFFAQFGIDLSPHFYITPQMTLNEFMLFLNQQLLSMNHS